MTRLSARPLAYSYIRFSDRTQARGDSLRRQLDRATAYAAKHELRLDESTTIRDLGLSAFHGDHKNSGALGAFLEAVRQNKIEPGSYLLVESMDRLSRENVSDALSTFMKIITAGIVIVTLMDEVVHSSKVYRDNWLDLMISLTKMAQAHEESSKKSDRLTAVWEAKRSQLASKEIATARCPGWLKVEKNKEGKRFFVVIEERAEVVRRIYRDLVAGLGRGTIARHLNQEGAPTFGHGVSWHGGSVQKITENPAVIGRYQPHTSSKASRDADPGKRKSNGRTPIGDPIEDYYPAIVDTELYLRAKRVSEDRSVTPGNSGGRKGTIYSNLFTGVGICVVCKKPMIYQTRKRSRPILVCSGKRNGLCKNDWRFQYTEIERQVLDWVTELEIVDNRSEQLRELGNEVSRLLMDRDHKIAHAKTLVDGFAAANSQIVIDKVLELEGEAKALDERIVAISDSIEELSTAPSTEERQAALSAWRAAAATLQGNDLYIVRAKIAQAYRSIVSRMLFLQSGSVQVVLKEATKQYTFYLEDLSRPTIYSIRVFDMKEPSFVAQEVERAQDAYATMLDLIEKAGLE